MACRKIVKKRSVVGCLKKTEKAFLPAVMALRSSVLGWVVVGALLDARHGKSNDSKMHITALAGRDGELTPACRSTRDHRAGSDGASGLVVRHGEAREIP